MTKHLVSWLQQNKFGASSDIPQLKDFCPAATEISSLDIPWIEVTDNQSPNEERWSPNQDSAGQMCYLTTWDAYQAYPNQIYDALLGGWSDYTSSKNAPMKHPYRKGMFCRDAFVNVMYIDPAGNIEDSNAGGTKVQTYQIVRFTLSFQTLPYHVDLPPGDVDSINPSWLEIHSRGGNLRLANKWGTYIFDPAGMSAYKGRAAQYGTYFYIPQIYIDIIVHRVTETQLYGDANGTKFLPVFAPFSGQANKLLIFGCQPETLLFDSYEVEPFGYPFASDHARRVFNVTLHFIFSSNTEDNDHGWNTAIDEDGKFFKIVYNNQHTKSPVALFDMAAEIFDVINP